MSEDSKSLEFRQVMLERLEILLSIINQICIGFVTIYISWMYLRTGLTGTGLHAWLVTIGVSKRSYLKNP